MAVTDLTGYTWVGNTNLTTYLNNGTEYFVNFTSNNEYFNSLQCPYYSADFGYLQYGGYDSEFPYQWNDDMGETISDGHWTNSAYQTIEITGGLDATNAILIAWLEANGTLTAPAPVGNTYELTHNLTNLTSGNISLTFVADTGYELPSSITVSNGTLVSWNQSTGVAVISGDDTTIVDAECVVAANGYEVYISNTSNITPARYGSVALYDGQDNTGISLGTLAQGSNGTYTITSGYLYAELAYSSDTYAIYINGSTTKPVVISADSQITINVAAGGSDR